jgi:hypothetical protein
LFRSRFRNEPIDIRLRKTKRARSLSPVLEQVRPRPVFQIPRNSIDKNFTNAAALSSRRVLDFGE